MWDPRQDGRSKGLQTIKHFFRQSHPLSTKIRKKGGIMTQFGNFLGLFKKKIGFPI